MPTNSALLGHSHLIARTKRHLSSLRTPQVLWDDQERREYLTGFHKRKLARLESKRRAAKERDHQALLADRREMREAKRKQARENYIDVETRLGGAALELDESVPGPAVRETREAFEGEEETATVTVVQDFDPLNPDGENLASAPTAQAKWEEDDDDGSEEKKRGWQRPKKEKQPEQKSKSFDGNKSKGLKGDSSKAKRAYTGKSARKSQKQSRVRDRKSKEDSGGGGGGRKKSKRKY